MDPQVLSILAVKQNLMRLHSAPLLLLRTSLLLLLFTRQELLSLLRMRPKRPFLTLILRNIPGYNMIFALQNRAHVFAELARPFFTLLPALHSSLSTSHLVLGKLSCGKPIPVIGTIAFVPLTLICNARSSEYCFESRSRKFCPC